MPKSRFYHIGSKNALLELLREGFEFEKILVATNAFKDPKTKEILSLAHKSKIPVVKTSRRVINRRSKGGGMESIVGLLIPTNTFSLETVINNIFDNGFEPNILVLDHLKYAQNIGAIFRTAYASGVNCVILPNKEFGYINEEVARISMGACFRIPVVNLSIINAIRILQKSGIPIYAIHMDGVEYYKADLTGPKAFIIGAEDVGVSSKVLENVEKKISIPMREGIGSLNVSVSAGVVLFERFRQIHSK